MSKETLIIVESPTKAKTISKFLGNNYTILASYGHVRDLPNKAAEIPESVKKEKWARLGINVEKDFEPLYIIPEDKKKRVAELKKAVKEASVIYLATDEDREGESISWHLYELLKPKGEVKRLVFHEITKEAIAAALKTPRSIDENLVKAQETRRIIDRLFGYTVSPLLWKKMAPRLSAGRVQSVAIRLLVEREEERITFKPAEYWDLNATLRKIKDSEFSAELTHLNQIRVASGKDFEPSTGKLKSVNSKSGANSKSDSKVRHLLNQDAVALASALLGGEATVTEVEEKPFTQRPYPPFTTSTLQQEAGRKLGFTAKRTMQVAQALYENGFITYMRTDSTNLSEEALTASRFLIKNEYGDLYLPKEPRLYKTKVKNAQEAHEAIRPAGSSFARVDEVASKLSTEAMRLYELIWKRTIASQMNDATGVRVGINIEIESPKGGDDEPARFRAAGKTITFPGFLRAYVEGSDDPESDLADMERILPPLKVGEKLKIEKITPLRHETQSPPRFTEGSLIKQLEGLGIGRPSTWATIVDVVMQRTYAFKKGSALVPTFLAIAVTRLMERYFPIVVNYEFTANLEEDLDAISRGEKRNLQYLNDFYLGSRPGLKGLVEGGEKIIDPRDVCGIPILNEDNEPSDLEVRIGRYGPFLTKRDQTESRASLPPDLSPDDLTYERAKHLLLEGSKGPESLGYHPVSNLPIYLKVGRFGPYVQEGDIIEGSKEKPKMASLLKGMNPEDVNLEVAVKLLSFPLNLGEREGVPIELFNGRYGPYIKCGSETRTLAEGTSPLDLTYEEALTLLEQPKVGRGGRGRATTANKSSTELGVHPDLKEKIKVYASGRYGPYISCGKVNASLPNGVTIEELTLDSAASLINARIERMGAR
jgi:DNA topoisomerase-1